MSTPATPERPQALLVAIDFSSSARRALDVALAWYPGAEITALHVIDAELAARAAAHGLGMVAEIIAKLRQRADQELAWLTQETSPGAVAPMIVEGVPFVEIVKIATDLDVDLIVMGMRQTTTQVGELLFGSTTEKVLRASHRPVLGVP